MKPLLLSTASMSVAVVAAACGSGPLSRPVYVARADAVCRSITAPGARPATAQESVAYAQRQADARAQALSRLRALAAPDSLARVVARFLAASRAGVEDYRAMAQAAQRNDRIGYELANLKRAVDAVDRTRAASQAGLHVCGQSTRALPDAALVASADAICRDADQAIIDRPRATSLTDPRAFATPLAASYPAVRSSQQRLLALVPKPAGAQAWRAFLAVYGQRLAVMNDELVAARAGSGARFAAAAQRDDGLARQEARVAAYLGLELCGASGTLGV